MNRIKAENIICAGSTAIIDYSVTGSDLFTGFFNKPYRMETHYDCDISAVPESVAAVSFVGCFLTVAWLFDAEIVTDELDRAFYDSIDDIKKGFENMYPQFSFGGAVKAGRLTENHSDKNRTAALFTGGIDATATMVSHLDENPLAVTLWGSYILKRSPEMKKAIDDSCRALGVENISIETNYRLNTDFGKLNSEIRKVNPKLDWYHDFHHGFTFFALMAPVVYLLGITKIYIGSSFYAAQKGTYFCASDPTIDNFVKIVDAAVSHDLYEMHRGEKCRSIVEYQKKSGKKININVCGEINSGVNCCRCEKCCRTMLAILCEGGDPGKLGFEGYDIKEITRLMRRHYRVGYMPNRYLHIQRNLKKNYSFFSCPKNLRWFYLMRIHKKLPWYYKLYTALKKKLKN